MDPALLCVRARSSTHRTRWCLAFMHNRLRPTCVLRTPEYIHRTHLVPSNMLCASHRPRKRKCALAIGGRSGEYRRPRVSIQNLGVKLCTRITMNAGTFHVTREYYNAAVPLSNHAEKYLACIGLDLAFSRRACGHSRWFMADVAPFPCSSSGHPCGGGTSGQPFEHVHAGNDEAVQIVLGCH